MADDKKDKKDETTAARPPVAVEFEIEFGDSRNRVMAWPPTMENLRGAWKKQNLLPDEMVEDLQGLPDLPGMRLRMDPVKGVALIYDPLALPENKELCEKIQRVIKAKLREDQGPSKPIERKSMDKDDVKTWMHWAARKVLSKEARVVSGTLPSVPEIGLLPGRVRIENYNSSARACKWLEGFDEHIERILNGTRTGT